MGFESRDVVASIKSQGGVRRALLIGTGSWSNQYVTRLPGVERDVDLLRDVLLDPHCGFQDENVDVLTTKNNNYPSRERIEEECARFLNSCGPDDFAFLYLGGHGFHDPETGVDYYVPFDAEPNFVGGRVVSYKADKCFSFKALNELVGRCPAKFKWVVVDACRVNLAARDGLDENVESIGALEAAEGTLLFQSCGLNQKSYEIPVAVDGDAVNHGLFTWHFCEGAKGKAANQDGVISPRGLFDYTRQMLEEARRNEPALQKQTPTYTCQELSYDDFVFVDFSDRDEIRARKAFEAARDFVVAGEYKRARVKICEATSLEPKNKDYQALKTRVETLLTEEATKTNVARSSGGLSSVWNIFRRQKRIKKRIKWSANPVEEANKRSSAGYEAFGKHDYLLAKKECDAALEFDPDCKGAIKLQKKTQAKLNKLAQTIREGNELFDKERYDEALAKAREAKALCIDYPDAVALEKKSIDPIVERLVQDGWEVYGEQDKEGALAKALEALKLKPNDVSAKRLYVTCRPFESTKPGARATLERNGVEFAFRYCPAGTFTMGSPSSESGRDDDEIQHSATIQEGFWICETETTQEQWNAVGVKKEDACCFKGDKLPVENVSWNESDAFIKKLNELGVAPSGWRFALPSEEQWEYACRAGTTGSTYGIPLNEAAWYYDNSGNKIHEVGTKQPNKWGIYDMLGNVWEWTSSKYEGGSSFVSRGGCWFNDAQDCRPAERSYCDPSLCNVILGFRFVLVRSQSR